ncbi:hypothetical protein IMCC3135_03030 [Granulosicoccus antarcticus IMCC3135]|uniref:Transposase n=1 Tax=Granulosicoccus antarcticus IMCC3135 TaxID=1192854 RepID=A0A2Z2NHU4_9GAMM|nr:hypothetical protein IMCC3135_03030 [Granulosicoccus antarcticus IMCC3135]
MGAERLYNRAVKSTCIKVLKVRVKDRHAPLLRSMATEVNQVWNYCNDLSDRMIRERGRWMSGFDFSAYTAGASKQFEHIGSSTIQEIAEHYASKRFSAKRRKLRWRKSFGDKRSLGWVPFKARAAHWKHGQVFFAGSHFKVWDSFGLANYKFRAGCFTEDARGRWYFCICVSVDRTCPKGQDSIGIDLGLKTVATCSDGTVLEGRWYRHLEGKLAKAQRARRKRRTRAIHAKIRNRRADALHKFSRHLVNRCGEIYVGDVSSSKLTKTTMAKSVLDASWASFKTMLDYKSQQAGIVYREINEAYTTRACSECGGLCGPQGIRALSVRDWQCVECGVQHDRDVNAARNILRLGAGHCAP